MRKVNFKSPEEFHTKLGLFFSTTIALPLLPFVWLYLEIKHSEFSGWLEAGMLTHVMGYLVPVISGLLVIKGHQIFKSKKNIATSENKLIDKLGVYYNGITTYYLFVSLAALLLAGGLYLSAKGILIVSYVILLFLMSFFRPTPKRYCKDLSLEGEEKDIILNQKEYLF
ncbi:hypothetical protein [Fulvivirga lutea]|uniref:Uncharacterized protein n=1 Tax=Fulvivirga lutea TaxID=2810512 RepID=A0A975A0E8_9BACT|nr:hypothetical protein [Fulvivirga lutea]QSE97191.1 hypothetical protein JR347_16605 [Fulvivirga lutea]